MPDVEAYDLIAYDVETGEEEWTLQTKRESF
jgi:hypothetical protein